MNAINNTASAPSGPGGRFAYLDHLKILLTILVLAVHTSITYGAVGSWFYRDPAEDFLTSVLLTAMNSLSQSFFMGLFFFIGGFFTVPSLARKGPGRFLADRLIRLGIPLVVFFFLLNPITCYPRYTLEEASPLPLIPFLGQCFRRFEYFGTGPLWFVQALLGFSLLAVLGRLLAPRLFAPRQSGTPQPTVRRSPTAALPTLLAVALGAGLVTFLTRLVYPMGAAVSNLQLGNFPQYLACFFAGMFVYRRGLLDPLVDRLSAPWRVVSVLCILTWPVMFAFGGALEGKDPSVFMGGAHWQAAAYALWEQIAAVAFSLTLLRFFKRRLGEPGPALRTLSANAYTVYCLHAPVLVWLAHVGRGIDLPPALKFLTLLCAGATACWLASDLVFRRLLALRRILY